MSYQDESVLVKGFYPKPKHPNAPDFVIAKGIYYTCQQFAEFMREFKAANPGEEWVNIDIQAVEGWQGCGRNRHLEA